jgi:hypothetical protein
LNGGEDKKLFKKFLGQEKVLISFGVEAYLANKLKMTLKHRITKKVNPKLKKVNHLAFLTFIRHLDT